MRSIIKSRISRLWTGIVALVIVFSLTMSAQTVFATNLSDSSVILTNMAPSANSSVIVVFKVSASNTGTTLTVQFPQYTGTTNGSVAGTQTPSSTISGVNCTALAPSGETWHDLPTVPTASGSGTTITFGTITGGYTASDFYCVALTGTSVTNPNAATTSDTAVITAGTDAAQTVALDVVSNDTVSVTATVPETFTLSVPASDSFTTNLTSSTYSQTSGALITINTNAKYGYDLYASGTGGLTSPSAGKTINTTSAGVNATLSAGTEGYLSSAVVTSGGSGGGTTTINAPYVSSGNANGAGIGTGQYLIASSTGTAINAEVTVKEWADISGSTPYGNDYADTLTFVGAGSF